MGNTYHVMARHKPTAVDLFCGAGGMGLGLEMAGYDTLLAIDKNKHVASTYRWNLNVDEVYVDDLSAAWDADIAKLNVGDVDVMTASPPCRTFSTAGKRPAVHTDNMLYRHAIRAARIMQPRIVVVENVPGILSIDGGHFMFGVRRRLESAGYPNRVLLLNSAEYMVPQVRYRVFVIGVRGVSFGDMPDVRPATSEHKVTVRDAVSDLAGLERGRTYGYIKDSAYAPAETTYQRMLRGNNDVLHNHHARDHSARIRKLFGAIPEGYSDRLDRRVITRGYYRPSGDESSPTITTKPDHFLHYKLNRIYTVRELARIQSFPDSFEFLGPRNAGGRGRHNAGSQYQQVGNAVPPLMAKALFKSLKPVLQ